MADSRTASARIISDTQRIIDIQQRVIFFLLSLIFAFVVTWLMAQPDHNQAQIYVLFILFLSLGLWVTEAVPPFTVGLLIVGFLVFAMGYYFNQVDPDNAARSVQQYVQTWSNSVIWLMLGGFFMAEATQRVGLDRSIFRYTIGYFGHQPRYVLLGIMLVTAVASMFMSNTATTAMIIAAVLPLLDNLGDNAPFSRSVLVGIPAAASFGGMGTIIGSPPNAITVEALSGLGIEISFLDWMLMGIPISLLLVLLFWAVLSRRFVPVVKHIEFSFLDEEDGHANDAIFQVKRRLVAVVIGVTVLLWLTTGWHGIPAAAVSFLPIVLLTMFRVVTGEHVRALPWDTLMLVAGGLSLGLAIKQTELAEYYVGLLQGYRLDFGVLLVVFSLLTILLSNFMSNTAATTILIPVAIVLSPTHPMVLPVVIGFSASAALLLPVSTPPNAIAFSTGRLEQRDLQFGGIVAMLAAPPLIIGIVLLLLRWL